MKIKKAEFVISNTNIDLCPKDGMPEYAFIGRSNVGKSSLINMLTERAKLAKISGRPGKTQLINHFVINDEWYLVDLPGYGYARASKTSRYAWEKFIAEYLTKREELVNVFVLLDSRLEPQIGVVKKAFHSPWFLQKLIRFQVLFYKKTLQSTSEKCKKTG